MLNHRVGQLDEAALRSRKGCKCAKGYQRTLCGHRRRMPDRVRGGGSRFSGIFEIVAAHKAGVVGWKRRPACADIDCRPRWPFATPCCPIYPRHPYRPKGSEGARERCSTSLSVGRPAPKGCRVPSPERITCSEYRPEIYKACLFIGLMCTDLPRLLPQRSLHH
jgi:hypothetical protein